MLSYIYSALPSLESPLMAGRVRWVGPALPLKCLAPYHLGIFKTPWNLLLNRSHRSCQAPRQRYSVHSCGEKAPMPLTHTTFSLASGRRPEALLPQLVGVGGLSAGRELAARLVPCLHSHFPRIVTLFRLDQMNRNKQQFAHHRNHRHALLHATSHQTMIIGSKG
jgi:hypothetical protein